MNKRPANDWLEIDNNIDVIDPDGWRMAGIAWEKPITYKKFKELVVQSTVRLRGGFPDKIEVKLDAEDECDE